MNCIERAKLFRIKAHMKTLSLKRLRHALTLPVVLLTFSANAELSFIFTNAAAQVMPRRDSIIFIQVDGFCINGKELRGE